jgi:hypothetical protein
MAMVSVHREQVNMPIHIDLKEQEQQQEEEEVGEEILVLLEDEDDINNNQEFYYLQQEPFDIPLEEEQLVDEQPMEQGDEAFYLANRTFYTTCHKISRQNSPSYRKRPPYTFLENWLIHSVFSKSQQILLRFPVIHPKVMMTEGDFIYTPHQMATNTENTMDQSTDHDQSYYENDLQQQQQQQQHQQLDYDYGDEEEYDYYDDTFIIGDEGVMVMSASAPDASQFMAEDDEDEDGDNNNNNNNQVSHSNLHASSLVMDENMWMGHSRYNSNGLTLHVVNPDETIEEEEEDQDPMYHNVVSSYNRPSTVSYQGQLQMVKEEEEEEEDQQEAYDYHQESQFNNDVHSNLSMSPEVLNWYRSADLRPVAYNNDPVVVEEGLLTTCDEEQHPVKTTNYGCSSSSSSTSSENSSCSISQRSAQSDEKSIITNHSSGSYQSLADIIITEEETQQDDTARTTSYGTLLPSHYQNRSMTVQQKKPVSPIMQVSVCLVDAAWIALDLAQNYVEDINGTKGITGFITNVFRIWKVLFLGAETMLGWGSHRLKTETVLTV